MRAAPGGRSRGPPCESMMDALPRAGAAWRRCSQCEGMTDMEKTHVSVNSGADACMHACICARACVFMCVYK
eukprot:209116-Chlamydomonas_euryale.AAC.4